MNPLTALVALAVTVFAFKSLPSGKGKRRDGSDEFMPKPDEEPIYGGSDPNDWTGSLKAYSPKLYGHGDRRPDGYIIEKRDDAGEQDWRPFSKHIITTAKWAETRMDRLADQDPDGEYRVIPVLRRTDL